MLFGFTDANKSADTISVLDIKSPYYPSWVTNSEFPSPNSTNTTNNILPPEKLIPIVVCICVIILASIAGIIFYIKHKRQQKNTFILEQQDPRKYNIVDTMIQGNPTYYSNMIVKPYDAEESVIMVENQNNIQISSTKDKKGKLVKTFETFKKDVAKPDSST